MKFNFKEFFSNIIKKIKQFWFKKITQPKLERKKRLDKINAEKALHKNFEKMFGVSPKKVKKLLNEIDEKYYLKLEQTDNNYLKEQLVEGKRFYNTHKTSDPYFYDVDTINIHNEYFANEDGLTFNDVIKNDSMSVKKEFEKQEDKIRFDNLDAKTKTRIKLIKRGK
jgi:hypothetical protein